MKTKVGLYGWIEQGFTLLDQKPLYIIDGLDKLDISLEEWYRILAEVNNDTNNEDEVWLNKEIDPAVLRMIDEHFKDGKHNEMFKEW